MTEEENQKPEDGTQEEEKSFFGIMVHSFFIIPFLIAVFSILLFASVQLLVRENKTAFDYLENVKTGGLTKRWQAAFELSKILSNPELVPDNERFESEMIHAFEKSKHDDPRVRQYLALAMGKTGNPAYFEPLAENLGEGSEQTLLAVIYALGMLGDPRASEPLIPYLDHDNARIRSTTVVALGNLGDKTVQSDLTQSLRDAEPNVRWGAAISLARMGNDAGRPVILNLMDRSYLEQFENVDPQEATQLLLTAIDASEHIRDPAFVERWRELSKTDKNMKVRSAAFDRLSKIQKQP